MNYESIYRRIITNRINHPLMLDQYGETHHIIPKCLGGDNSKSNLVRLTAREHFICHALLAEMYDKYSPEWYKLNHAFMIMGTGNAKQSRYMNSRLYEQKKVDFAATMSYSQSGNKNSSWGTVWVVNDTLRDSKKVTRTDLERYLKLGYRCGRISNFDTHIRRSRRELNKEQFLANRVDGHYLADSMLI